MACRLCVFYATHFTQNSDDDQLTDSDSEVLLTVCLCFIIV